MTTRVRNVGLRQGNHLCRMHQTERLAFIADGLPVALASAQGFWRAAKLLDGQVREAVVLARHANEEAAKVLIVMAMIRCPRQLVSSRMGSMVKWFYSHLARLIYAEATGWKSTDVAQLREYVDMGRKSHRVDGAVGEYIMPNSTIFRREGQLYADIEGYKDEGVSWSNPSSLIHPLSSSGQTPTALGLAESMSRLGMFTGRGVELTAQIWGKMEFKEEESSREAQALTRTLLNRLIAEKLPVEEAEEEEVQWLYEAWQLPM